MIKIGKAIEGVSINGKEWLLDKNSEIKYFESIDNAKLFLIENGYSEFSDDEFQDCFFFENY